jgi:hypothetical protein
LRNDNPFAVHIFFGNSKPGSSKDFLSSFVDELRKRLQEGILDKEGKIHGIKVQPLICDAAFSKE